MEWDFVQPCAECGQWTCTHAQLVSQMREAEEKAYEVAEKIEKSKKEADRLCQQLARLVEAARPTVEEKHYSVWCICERCETIRSTLAQALKEVQP